MYLKLINTLSELINTRYKTLLSSFDTSLSTFIGVLIIIAHDKLLFIIIRYSSWQIAIHHETIDLLFLIHFHGRREEFFLEGQKLRY